MKLTVLYKNVQTVNIQIKTQHFFICGTHTPLTLPQPLLLVAAIEYVPSVLPAQTHLNIKPLRNNVPLHAHN